MKKWIHVLRHTEFELMTRVNYSVLRVLLILSMILPLGLQAVDAQDSESAKSVDTTTIVGSYRTALGQYWSADYEAAEAGFEQILKKDPRNASALIYLADAQSAQGKKGPAKDNYKRALQVLLEKIDLREEILPEVKASGMYNELTYCLNALGRYEEAKEYGLMGLIDRESPDQFVNIAYTFYKLAQPDVARENYCLALKSSQPKDVLNLTYQRYTQLFEGGQSWVDCPDEAPQQLKGNYYALIISVGKYQDPKVTPLNYAENDAWELFEVLTDPRTGLFEPRNVARLTNEDATRQAVEFGFDDIAARAQNKDDVFFVFYAGHGFTYPNSADTYWLTFDTIVGNQEGHRIKSTSFSNLSLAKKLADIKANTVVLFVDACFSAGMVDRPATIRGLETYLGSGKDYVIISSSQADQLSIESSRLKHGLFSFYIINGLEGQADENRDGWVEIEELWRYVKTEVALNARRMGKKQDPRRSGSSGRPIILSKNPNL